MAGMGNNPETISAGYYHDVVMSQGCQRGWWVGTCLRASIYDGCHILQLWMVSRTVVMVLGSGRSEGGECWFFQN